MVKVQSSRFQPVEGSSALQLFLMPVQLQTGQYQLPDTKCHQLRRREVHQNPHCMKYFPLLQRIAWWVEFESWPPQGRCPATASNFQHPAWQNLPHYICSTGLDYKAFTWLRDFLLIFSENCNEAVIGRLWGSRGKFKTMQAF